MVEMIKVIVNNTNYIVMFKNSSYQLMENNEVVFEDTNFNNVRDKLFEESGI